MRKPVQCMFSSSDHEPVLQVLSPYSLPSSSLSINLCLRLSQVLISRPKSANWHCSGVFDTFRLICFQRQLLDGIHSESAVPRRTHVHIACDRASARDRVHRLRLRYVHLHLHVVRLQCSLRWGHTEPDCYVCCCRHAGTFMCLGM